MNDSTNYCSHPNLYYRQILFPAAALLVYYPQFFPHHSYFLHFLSLSLRLPSPSSCMFLYIAVFIRITNIMYVPLYRCLHQNHQHHVCSFISLSSSESPTSCMFLYIAVFIRITNIMYVPLHRCLHQNHQHHHVCSFISLSSSESPTSSLSINENISSSLPL